MQKIIVPDFMLVGAAKCGTTSLFEVLGEHPQIYIPEIISMVQNIVYNQINFLHS